VTLAPADLALLSAVAFATSILSAIVGMAGGLVLLSVMLLYLDPLVAIPLHGVVQLVANGSRAWVQRRHVDRGIALRYGALLLPMGFAGLALARRIPPDGTRLAIGAFALMATWVPGWLMLGAHPEAVDRNRRFVLLGGVVGFLNTTLGATGPLIAPFFLNLGLGRQALVGTKAVCQLLGHLAKALVFGAAGFAYWQWAGPLALLCATGVIGTAVGSRILDRVDERRFVILYKTVLTATALKLVFDAVTA
jgi:uncharacterized membrane protein YfcA